MPVSILVGRVEAILFDAVTREPCGATESGEVLRCEVRFRLERQYLLWS